VYDKSSAPCSERGADRRGSMINAIETEYSGLLFRSKLEARHAMFFDKYLIKWEYEPHYMEGVGQSYLPDFYLPEIKIYFEVKGTSVPGANRAVAVIKACWEDGSISKDTRFVLSDGDNPVMYQYNKKKIEKGSLNITACLDCGAHFFYIKDTPCLRCGNLRTYKSEYGYPPNQEIDMKRLLGYIPKRGDLWLYPVFELPQIRSEWK
jgi:hypothetical protein